MSILIGFVDEIAKQADLIDKDVFKKMSPYSQENLINARDTIRETLKSKAQSQVKEKIIEGALDSVKNQAYNIARTATKNEKSDALEAVPSFKKAKKSLKL